MNQACVSLEEVLAAAGARAASLVPETSGYLALAVADATSRLPYAHEDRGVLLTVDGSVIVPRKAPIAAAPEAARVLRDLLKRLLAMSTGTMPGLASAARPRSEELDVDRVVSDIEAALIPVNRAAAKRALARLARETLKAKELGKLKKKSTPPPAPQPPAPRVAAPQPIVTAPIVTAPAPIAPPPAPIVTAPIVTAPAPIAPPPAPIAPPPMVTAPPLRLADLITPPAAVAAEPAPEPVVAAPAPKPIAMAPAPKPVAVTPAPEPVAMTSAPFEIDVELSAGPSEVAPRVAIEEQAPVDAAPAHEHVATMQGLGEAPAAVLFNEPSALTDLANLDAVEAIEAQSSEDAATPWNESDRTIADPAAMAVIEAIYREGSLYHEGSLALDAPDLDSPPPRDEPLTHTDPSEARAVSPSPDDSILTRPLPLRGTFAAHHEITGAQAFEVSTSPTIEREDAIEEPLQLVFEDPPAPAIVRRPTEFAVPDALTAEAGPVALLSQLQGSRADELLESFSAEDQGDRAVAAAAGSLRRMTGVDETGSPRPAAQPTFLRVPPPPRKQIQALEDLDDELPLPPPRSRTPKASRWPLAVFAVGVLALFAAWLYRPTLAHDFFGIVTRLRPAPTAPVEATPTHASDDAPAALAAPSSAPEAPAAAPQRGHDTRATTSSGDGTRRRRD